MGEILKNETGMEMTAVPYKGNIPAMTDLVAGHVQFMFSDPSGVPMISGGKVRALGVSSKSRVGVLPDVPPLAEAGLPGFDAVSWLMLFAPGETPRPIVDKLNAEIGAFLKLPATKAAIAKNAQIPHDGADVDTLRRFVSAEIERWAAVVKKAGVAGSQ
jgi:tripartite-type tricarboxylate transporter receptor subunit TctC